jgi:hypothetical protein
MARPNKRKVDYFPHDCTHGKTMTIIEKKYGNDGYAFWFKLLETLGNTENHYIDLTNDEDLIYLSSETNLDEEKCIEILDLLSRLDAIDSELWETKRIVWSDNFIENIRDAYSKRKTNLPQKPGLSERKRSSRDENEQSKEEENKEEKNKENSGVSSESEKIFDYWQKLDGTTDHQTNLYEHKKSIDRRLDDFTPEQICEAIKRLNDLYTGKYDTWLTTKWSCRDFMKTKSGEHVEKVLKEFDHFLNGSSEKNKSIKEFKEAE